MSTKELPVPQPVGTGYIKLSDGTEIELKILIIDIRESGFSPFGGINFDVKTVGGVTTKHVPENLKKQVMEKPLAPPEPPRDGWEILYIVEQKPAEAWDIINSSKGLFQVKVIAETVMVSRNMNYRTPHNEPIYWVSWVLKISWVPVEKR